MKKSIFCIIAISICASFCLDSCSKSTNNSNDQNANENTAKGEVAEQPSSEPQIQDNAANGDIKVTETKPTEAPAADPNGETAKPEETIVQNDATNPAPKYVEKELNKEDALPKTEPRVVGDFGSAKWKEFEEKYEAPLIAIDSGKEIIAEMEKSLDLVCDPQTKQQTMPSGVVFQAVNCVSKQRIMDNAENRKGYFHREIDRNEKKFHFADDCNPETTSIYAVLTSPTDHVSRVFMLKEDIDIYSCFAQYASTKDFPASGEFEIQAEEYPFMDVKGLYVTLNQLETRIAGLDEGADATGGKIKQEKTVFLFAGDNPRHVDSWQYENKESNTEKGSIISYSGFTKSAKWNGTKIEQTEQTKSNRGESSQMETQMDEMLEAEYHVTGDFGSAQWKDFENQSTKSFIEVNPGEDIIAKMEQSLSLVCTNDLKELPNETLQDGTKFQEIHCVSKQSYLNENNPNDEHRGYLKKPLDGIVPSDIEFELIHMCSSKCIEYKCEECAFFDDEKEMEFVKYENIDLTQDNVSPRRYALSELKSPYPLTITKHSLMSERYLLGKIASFCILTKEGN